MKASKALMGWRIKKIERRRESEHGGNAVQCAEHKAMGRLGKTVTPRIFSEGRHQSFVPSS